MFSGCLPSVREGHFAKAQADKQMNKLDMFTHRFRLTGCWLLFIACLARCLLVWVGLRFFALVCLVLFGFGGVLLLACQIRCSGCCWSVDVC